MKTQSSERRPFSVAIPDQTGSTVAERVEILADMTWDEELQEWLITPEGRAQIEEVKARHMGLMLPSELKELRSRIGFSQRQMGELFQAGGKSWTRWESGKHRPSRSISLLIRALYEGEMSLEYLSARAGLPAARAAFAETPAPSPL